MPASLAEATKGRDLRREAPAPAHARPVAKRADLVRLDFLLEDETPEPIRERADIDIRQLRHHTKNALQRIMGLVSGAPGLSGTPEGERIARMLERRIQLSAEVSDALFGLTHAPASITVRLKSLCGNLVELLADGAQSVRVRVAVRGECPARARDAVVRIAHELVGNAMKHGMRHRPRGRIAVRLRTEPDGATRLTVSDDGHGFQGAAAPGEGLSVAMALAEQLGGALTLRRDRETVAELVLPAAATATAH
jgi:two-component sensor histidine kinase